MARFFIDRPIFAWVIAIIIMLAGVGSIFSLPVEQFPDIAPPQVNISIDAQYSLVPANPGSSRKSSCCCLCKCTRLSGSSWRNSCLKKWTEVIDCKPETNPGAELFMRMRV